MGEVFSLFHLSKSRSTTVLKHNITIEAVLLDCSYWCIYVFITAVAVNVFICFLNVCVVLCVHSCSFCVFLCLFCIYFCYFVSFFCLIIMHLCFSSVRLFWVSLAV